MHGKRHAAIALLYGGDHLLPRGRRGGQCDKDLRPSRCRHVNGVNFVKQVGIHAFIVLVTVGDDKSVGMGQMGSSGAYSRKAVAFDTRTLQSSIRRFSDVSSTISLGISCGCGRAGLDRASLEAVGLRTADEEGFPLRGEREGGRQNLVGRRKVFQNEGGMVGSLTRLTSSSRAADPVDDETAGPSWGSEVLRPVGRDWIPRRPAAKRFE